MKKQNVSRLTTTACIALCALGVATTSKAQLINGGFEAGAAFGNPAVYGAPGWINFGPFSGTASAPIDPVRTGIGSLVLGAAGGFSVPGAFQSLPAAPGQEWDFQGYTYSGQMPGGATFGLLKIVFEDALGNDLVPASASIGGINVPFPGIESTPFQNSASTPNVWNFTQARGVAPAGTASVSFFALLVDEFSATVWFDDLNATLIPEPSSMALVGIGAAALLFRRRK